MYKVAIIEDDPMVSMINRHYVEQDKRFCVVRCLSSGNEAFEFLKNNRVDLVLLDVYMPGMDGISLLKKLRMEEIAVDVIMVTASNDKKTFDTSMRFGVVDYLVKPFVKERFQQSLNKYIEHIKAREGIFVLNQENIDNIINISSENFETDMPKGIQSSTLDKIRTYLCSFDCSTGHTADQIADNLGITRVTIKRYMKYLILKKEVSSRLDYETGGRPCMIYYYSQISYER